MSEYSAYRHNSKNSRPDHKPHKDEEAGFTTVYDLDLATPHSDTRSSSSTTDFSSSHHTAGHDEDKWKHLRLKLMRMATVKRLQLLWGLLALFGTMAWISLMPAYAFRYDHLLPRFHQSVVLCLSPSSSSYIIVYLVSAHALPFAHLHPLWFFFY